MAFTLQCPHCDHKQKVDDDKAGKPVRCTECEKIIKPTRSKTMLSPDVGIKDSAKSKPIPTVRAAPSKAKKRDDDDDEPRSRRKQRRDEEDDDERRPTPRKRGGKEGNANLLIVAGGGVALVLLLLLCGGFGVGVYFTLPEDKPAPPPPPIVRIDPPIIFNPPIIRNPPVVQPPIFNPPFQQPGRDPFGREVLDPNNPQEIDRVIMLLKGPENDRAPAYSWLQAATTTHPRRMELAAVLDSMVKSHVDVAPIGGNEPLFNAYYRWADKENIPTLIHIVDNLNQQGFNTFHHEKAMRLLGTFKDPRGIDPILKHMNRNVRPREIAVAALTDMGSIAEPKVLKYFNHPEEYGERQGARRLILAYKTSTDVILTQCIADLDTDEQGRRDSAAQWIARQPVNAQRRNQVAAALNKALPRNNFNVNQDMLTLLENWGTAENTPTLVQMLDQDKSRNQCIRVLGKLRDPNGMKAVARAMSHPFTQNEVKKALRDYGPGAEAIVIEALAGAKDGNVRRSYVQFLAEIGTRNQSIPALQQLAFQNPQDRFLGNEIANAIKTINFRGK